MLLDSKLVKRKVHRSLSESKYFDEYYKMVTSELCMDGIWTNVF